jgi:aspartyl-tRNA(Asn)/glutamyl-tRNA(Gln) amidotransferase subunit B
LPPVELDDAQIEAVRAEMPVMPDEWRKRLSTLGLDKSAMETLLDAELDSTTISYLALVEEAIADKDFAKALTNWIVNLEVPLRRDETAKLNEQLTNQGRLAAYRAAYDLVKASQLSSSNAKTLLNKILTGTEQIQDVEAFAKQHNLIQESNEGEMTKVVAKVLEENPKAAEDVKNGEMKVIGFLVGQIMKQSQGRANPQMAQELIKKQLGL